MAMLLPLGTHAMTILHLPDMSCGHCSGVITRTIAALDPAATLHFDMAQRTVAIESVCTPAQLLPALAASGYPATVAA